jgi:hypothetical protein
MSRESARPAPAAPPSAALAKTPDLPFLPERRGTPVSPPTAHLLVRNFQQLEDVGEKSAGTQAHLTGTALLEMYGRRVEAVLGYASFAAFVEDKLGIPASTAYDRMMLASATTRAELERWGVTKARLGLRIAQALDRKGLAALLARSEGGRQVPAPPLPLETPKMLPPRTGMAPTDVARSITFEMATTAQLATALALLTKGGEEAPTPPSRRAKEAGELVEKVARLHPALHDVGVKAYMHKGELHVRVRPLHGREQYEALAAYLKELAKT